MAMRRRTIEEVLAGVAMAMLIWGCAETWAPEPGAGDGAGEAAEGAASLEQALDRVASALGVGEDGRPGELDDRDEAPAFGSEELEREHGRDEGDRDVADPLDEAPTGVAFREFHVMIAWGRLRPNEHEPVPLRWDPQLTVPEGDGVHVRRELRFERGDRVHPQEVRHEVRISSATGPGVDGVIVVVRIRADEDAARSFLRFRSLPFSLQVPATELAELDRVTLLDRSGNGVLLVALERPSRDTCPTGFMHGRWARRHEQGGVFGGAWSTESGRREGYVAGRFGVTDAGEQLFSGKMIDGAGRFVAFVSGEWGEGRYAGHLFGRDGVERGRVRGGYAAGDEGGYGHFRGAWGLACRPADPPECDPTSERTCERPLEERPADEGTDGAGRDSGGVDESGTRG
jgi:hypothetical protein